MPRSLVAGGAGFLGSHLCDRLIEEGHEVICMDNLLTGSMDNITHLQNHENFTFVKHDVTRHIEVKGPLDYVLHFASPASPKDYLKHPIHTLKVGALGTLNALGLAKAKGATFLLASSSEVYGDPEVNPQPESYWGNVNPVGPRSVYDEAKRYAEAITMAYHNVHGLDIKIARIFNTYGERMGIDDGRALPNFVTQALQNKPLTVYGDGSQTRSFCWVGDMTDGIYRLLLWDPPSRRLKPQHPKPNTQDLIPVFNLGNPDEVSILNFAREVIEITGSQSEIVFKPLPVNDPKVRRPDISRAKQVLDWELKVARREGVEKVLNYFRSQVNKSVNEDGAEPKEAMH